MGVNLPKADAEAGYLQRLPDSSTSALGRLLRFVKSNIRPKPALWLSTKGDDGYDQEISDNLERGHEYIH